MTRTLVIGDVHGCAHALEQVLALGRADRVVLVGDLFPKGPDPLRTWHVLRDAGAVAVMGNHDRRLLDVWGLPGVRVHHATWPKLPDACRDWLEQLPISREEAGWTVVHAGVHPVLGLAGTPAIMAMTMRRWPNDLDPANPFWWQVYERPERIVYGHDAMRGFQRHERTVGLDSGCVYGNVLTGFVLETGEHFQASNDPWGIITVA